MSETRSRPAAFGSSGLAIDAMNEYQGRPGKTLPFAKPAGSGKRDGDGDKSAEEEREAMLDIIRQQPEINISRTVLLHRQVDSGRYRVNASRVARRLLDFEDRIQDQDKGGASSSSNGRSSGSSTSQDGSSN